MFVFTLYIPDFFNRAREPDKSYMIKEMFRRNIEHFLKKRIYEKLGISQMK